MIKKFEYETTERPWNNPMDGSYLTERGVLGWELVQVLKTGERVETLQYIFKRPVQFQEID